MPKQVRAELLEVPPVSPLERRLNIFSTSSEPQGRPSIGPVPKSALLSKLNNFLPQLQAANQQLHSAMQERPASDFDVENVPEEQECGYIEMDLACGLIDLKDERAVAAAEQAVAGQRPDLHQEHLDEASNDDSSDDSSEGSSSSEEEAEDEEMHVASHSHSGDGKDPQPANVSDSAAFHPGNGGIGLSAYAAQSAKQQLKGQAGSQNGAHVPARTVKGQHIAHRGKRKQRPAITEL